MKKKRWIAMGIIVAMIAGVLPDVPGEAKTVIYPTVATGEAVEQAVATEMTLRPAWGKALKICRKGTRVPLRR